MKKITIYLTIVAALLCAVSCTKEKPVDVDINCPVITLSGPELCGTKALLHSSDFTGNTALQVYDYRTTYTNNVATTETTPFISNTAKYGNGSTSYQNQSWGFDKVGGKDVTYSWMDDSRKACDHSFFSWLTTDKDGLDAASLFGTGGLSYDGTSRTLTVPNTAMTLASKQFDFCYSSIVERKKAQADYSPVAMPLHHLFTSFGVKAYNYTADKITITSVKLYGLVNNKGAQVSYNVGTGKTTATYGTSDLTKLSGVELVGSQIEMATNTGVKNIINSSSWGSHATSAEDALFLMWPQTASELNIATTPAVNDSGEVTAGSGQAFLVIGYKVNTGSVQYKALPLRPESWVVDGSNTIGWDAGTCHQLEIAFTDTQVSLKVTVQPWDLYEPEIDYTGEILLKEGGQLKFIGSGSTCTVDEAYHRVYFKGGNPIRATFALDAPLDATWMISKKGDYDAFEIDIYSEGTVSYGDKIDTATGTIDGNTVTFTIYPKLTDPDSDREITLSFSVRCSNGNVYSVDDLIQGSDPSNYYTIVLQAS